MILGSVRIVLELKEDSKIDAKIEFSNEWKDIIPESDVKEVGNKIHDCLLDILRNNNKQTKEEK